MTREKLRQAQEIVTVLDRIDRVLEVHSDNGTTLAFRTSAFGTDIQSLAYTDCRSDFLRLLFTKKQQLEKKLKEL